MKYTEYPDVNKVLEFLVAGLKKILGDQLLGVYLTGSLTYGDFDGQSSDIDFLAVLDKELSKQQLTDIKAMHIKIGKEVPKWAKRLEGSYITRAMLETTDRPQKKRPYVNGGKVHHYKYGNEWIINLYAMRDCGRALYGPKAKDIFPRVTIEQVRMASRQDLDDDWLPKLEDPEAFKTKDYDGEHIKAYATLTMCRILYRLQNDDVSSKRVASAWAKEKYGDKWEDLITTAEQWQHGKRMSPEKDVRDFIKFTLNEANKA